MVSPRAGPAFYESSRLYSVVSATPMGVYQLFRYLCALVNTLMMLSFEGAIAITNNASITEHQSNNGEEK